MKLMPGAEIRILAAGDTKTGHAVYIHLFDRELAGISVCVHGKRELISDRVRWLRGKIALVPCPAFHRRLPDARADAHGIRPVRLMLQAGNDAHEAVTKEDIHMLAVAIIQAYGFQLVLGAEFLNNHDELAKKHCEEGAPGKALYLFQNRNDCRTFARKHRAEHIT